MFLFVDVSSPISSHPQVSTAIQQTQSFPRFKHFSGAAVTHFYKMHRKHLGRYSHQLTSIAVALGKSLALAPKGKHDHAFVVSDLGSSEKSLWFLDFYLTNRLIFCTSLTHGGKTQR